VKRDVVLRIRSSQFLVPAIRRGVETSGSFICVIRGSNASGDDGVLDKFDVGGSSGAATHSIPAAASQGVAAITAVLGLTYSNHHPQQSGPTTASWASAGALASVPSRADACAGRRARPDHSACHQRGSAFMASGTSRSAVPLA
jgi:hypothetical protein